MSISSLRSASASVAFSVLSVFVVTGCATTDNFGDEIQQVSNDWKKAEQKAKKAEDMIKDGNRQVRRGNEQQREGAKEEKAAQNRLAVAKENYNVFVATTGSAETAEEAEQEAKQLKKLTTDLRRAEDAYQDARNRQKRGRENVANGTSKVKRGQKLLAEGKAQMRKIELEYREVTQEAQ